jgi:hypothetical protein
MTILNYFKIQINVFQLSYKKIFFHFLFIIIIIIFKFKNQKEELEKVENKTFNK